MELLAWHAANVMNVHLKKKVTPAKLLGKKKNMSEEKKLQEFNKLQEVLRREGEKSGPNNS